MVMAGWREGKFAILAGCLMAKEDETESIVSWEERSWGGTLLQFTNLLKRTIPIKPRLIFLPLSQDSQDGASAQGPNTCSYS